MENTTEIRDVEAMVVDGDVTSLLRRVRGRKGPRNNYNSCWNGSVMENTIEIRDVEAKDRGSSGPTGIDIWD